MKNILRWLALILLFSGCGGSKTLYMDDWPDYDESRDADSLYYNSETIAHDR